jgi:hypothetical protein
VNDFRPKVVLPEGIELSTSPLPRECSTTELRQPAFDLCLSLTAWAEQIAATIGARRGV